MEGGTSKHDIEELSKQENDKEMVFDEQELMSLEEKITQNFKEHSLIPSSMDVT